MASVCALHATQPDPLIYQTAAAKLKVQPSECLVIEDSTVGLNAATAAGMACLITYTRTGINEPFKEALCVVSALDQGKVTVPKLKDLLDAGKRSDDRAIAA